jgi:hypothetical protein
MHTFFIIILRIKATLHTGCEPLVLAATAERAHVKSQRVCDVAVLLN